MIVCVSPSSQHYDETHNTLKYANRAKNIKTKVSRNMINVNRHVSQYVKAIYELTQEVEELKKRLGDSTKEAMDKLRKQETQRDLLVKEGCKRIKAAYENSQDLRKARIQDFRNMKLIERRMALVTAWMAAFDVVFSTKGEAPPKALLVVRSEAEKVLQELENNRFGLQHRLQGPSPERDIDRALDSALRNVQSADGSTDADMAVLNSEATLCKMMIERDFYQSLAEVNADISTPISVLSKAHFETVASLNQLNLQDDSASDAVRQTLQELMKACTDATSQVIKPNGELITPQESFTIPRVNFDTPRKKTTRTVLTDMASPIRGPFAQGNSGAPGASPLVRPSPRAFKVGTPKKAVSFAKKPPKKKRVRWQDETEAEDIKLVTLEDNKRLRAETEQHSFANVSSTSGAAHRHPLPISSSSLSSAATTRNIETQEKQYHHHSLDQQPPPRRNNKMEMGFLSKSKRDTSPTPPPANTTSSRTTSLTASTATASIHNPRNRRNDYPLSEADTSIINLKPTSRPSTIFENDMAEDLTRPWKASLTSQARAKRRVSSGSIAGASRAVAARRRPGHHHHHHHHYYSNPHHSSPESGNTSIIFKSGHARRMPRVPEKENSSMGAGGVAGGGGGGGGSHGHPHVLSPARSASMFKSGSRRITILGRGDLMAAGVGRRVSVSGAQLLDRMVGGMGKAVGQSSRPIPWR